MSNQTPAPDIATKQFWENNDRFADLFNAVLFHGEQIIDPKKLKGRAGDVSASVPLRKHFQHVKKYEDVTKIYEGAELSILGIENQNKIHYAMPLRARLYDDLDYLKECSSLTGIHKDFKDFANSDEFLSGIKKDDKLHFSIRIVIYYGEMHWDGPRKLSDMVKIPEAFRRFFQDYEMNLVCIVDNEAAALHYQNESVRNLMTQLHLLYKKDWDRIKEMDVELDNDTLAVIASVTGEEYLQKQAEKKGGLKMCNALNELKQESHAEGRIEGEQIMGKLIQILLKEGNLEAINVVSQDEAERQRYFRKYGIS